MAAQSSPIALGTSAPAFALPGVDGAVWTTERARGPAGLVIMVICNHCPYVLAVLDRIVRDAHDLQVLGYGVVAVSSNDVAVYPADGFEQMKALSAQAKFGFPYLYDESQALARALDAACTPDFYGYDAKLALRYHGRLDASRRDPAPADAPRELVDALRTVQLGAPPPIQQHPSVGCSIKWRD